jgi:hypothetical protein
MCDIQGSPRAPSLLIATASSKILKTPNGFDNLLERLKEFTES